MEENFVTTTVLLCFAAEDILWMKGILQMEPARGKRLAAGLGLFALLAFYEGAVGLGVNAPVLRIGIKSILMMVIFREKAGHVFVKYLFSIFYMSVILRPVRVGFIMVCRQFGTDWNVGLPSVVSELLQVLALLLVVLFLRKKAVWREKIKEISLRYYVIGFFVGFFISGVWEVGHIILRDQPKDVAAFYELICLLCTEAMYLLGIALPFIDELRLQYQKESRLKDELLHMREEYYQSLRGNMESARIVRHDLRHHLEMLDRCLEEERYDEARAYLRQMGAHVEGIGRSMKSVNHALADAVIANQCARMPKDMTLICEGKLPEDFSMEDYDLCTIFANLLSNAREACEKLREHEKVIRLSIRQKGGTTILKIRNPVEGEVDLQKLGSFTTKKEKDGHGCGLRSVKKIAEKYGGQMDADVKDEIITFRIFL